MTAFIFIGAVSDIGFVLLSELLKEILLKICRKT